MFAAASASNPPLVWVKPILQRSEVPMVWLLVGLINAGVDEPIVTVTVAVVGINVLTVHCMFGDETTIVSHTPDVALTVTLAACKLLKAKVVADGDAELSVAPGNVIFRISFTAAVWLTLNTIVCFAVTADVIILPRL